MRAHNKWRQPLLKQYLISYTGIALLAILIAGSICIISYSFELVHREKTDAKNRTRIASEYIEAQIERIEYIASDISIQRQYLPRVVDFNYENEHNMMKSFGNYQNMLPFDFRYYLYYSGMDAVYSSSAKYTWYIYSAYLIGGEDAALVTGLFANDGGITAGKNDLIIVLPIPQQKTNTRLIAMLPLNDFLKNAMEVSGLTGCEFSLYLNGELLSGSGNGEYEQCIRDGLVLRNDYVGSSWFENTALLHSVEILLPSVLVIVYIAFLLSFKSYQPIRTLASNYIGYDDMGDEFKSIERMLSILIEENSKSRKNLDGMSMLINEQQELLKERYVRLILDEGSTEGMTAIMENAGIHFPGEFSTIILVRCPESKVVDMCSDIELLSIPYEVVFYTVPAENGVVALINASSQAEVLSGIDMLSTMLDKQYELSFSGICDSQQDIPKLWKKLNQNNNTDSLVQVAIRSVLDAVSVGDSKGASIHVREIENDLLRNLDNEAETIIVRTNLIRSLHTYAQENGYKVGDEVFAGALLSKDLDSYLVSVNRIVTLLCSDNNPENGKENGKGTEIITFINENIGSTELSLEYIADKFHISTRFASMQIHALTGFSYIDYVKRVRIEKACELMKNTDYSVADIGTRVGYTNISYFIKLFRENTGYTPTAYRSINVCDDK